MPEETVPMLTLARGETREFLEKAGAFLVYLKELETGWQELDLSRLVEEAGGPPNVCVLGVDLIEGFCRQGVLASERVHGIVRPVVRMLKRCHELGVRDYIFPCDRHPADSPEFKAFPPHCVEGTGEAELVREIRELPFAGSFKVWPKRSISSLLGTGLEPFLRERPHFRRLIAIGDCTDLCLYQLAVGLRLLANVHELGWEVVVPASAAQTYDLSVETAARSGAMPHDGDLMHLVFLYHMQLNGVHVVSDLV
ncbi:MAG: cysteine hydrolase [Armatimonadetes bacterium]|nr:cysteine hydrolase [Armatimonadota bacterium]